MDDARAIITAGSGADGVIAILGLATHSYLHIDARWSVRPDRYG